MPKATETFKEFFKPTISISTAASHNGTSDWATLRSHCPRPDRPGHGVRIHHGKHFRRLFQKNDSVIFRFKFLEDRTGIGAIFPGNTRLGSQGRLGQPGIGRIPRYAAQPQFFHPTPSQVRKIDPTLWRLRILFNTTVNGSRERRACCFLLTGDKFRVSRFTHCRYSFESILTVGTRPPPDPLS